ncbi:unnamed protein product, partial [Brenthis ino]
MTRGRGGRGRVRTQRCPAFIYYATRGALGAGNAARRGGGRIPGGRRRGPPGVAKITRPKLSRKSPDVSIESHFKISHLETYSNSGAKGEHLRQPRTTVSAHWQHIHCP